MTTSTCAASLRIRSRPSSLRRSMATERLPEFSRANPNDWPFFIGVHWRA